MARIRILNQIMCITCILKHGEAMSASKFMILCLKILKEKRCYSIWDLLRYPPITTFLIRYAKKKRDFLRSPFGEHCRTTDTTKYTTTRFIPPLYREASCRWVIFRREHIHPSWN